MEQLNDRLREIAEMLAPGLGIPVGNKVYFFIQSSSTKQSDGFAPRSSVFSQRGKILISIKWNDSPIGAFGLLVTLKTPLLGKDVMFYETTLFTSIKSPDGKIEVQNIDTIRKEVLNWANKITMGFTT